MPSFRIRAVVRAFVVVMAVVGVVSSVRQLAAQNRAPMADPTINHVGIIVRDIKKTTQMFEEAFGIDIPEPTPFAPLIYLENPPAGLEKSKILMVHFKIGSLGIELIEPVSGPGPHLDHLNKFGPGLQHIALSVKDQPGVIKYLRSKGGAFSMRTYVDMKDTMGVTWEVQGAQ
jgi:methylmalonyl-CoA/ethylmalonyl-CoA epimerase